MSIPCRHWRDCGVVGGGCCAIGAFDRPSFGICLVSCASYDGPPRNGMAQLLVRGHALPSSHRERHARVLTGDGASRPLYSRRTRPVGRAVVNGSAGALRPAQPRPERICPRCGGLKRATPDPPKRSCVIAAKPGDERKYLGDGVHGLLGSLGIHDCPKWMAGSCAGRRASLNRTHRAVEGGVRRLIEPFTANRRVTP